jgi:flagellar basal body-associated protein FliL
MKIVEDRPSASPPGNVLSLVARTLAIIAAALVLVILGGTVYAFFLKAPVAPAATSGADAVEKVLGATSASGEVPGAAATPGGPAALPAADIFTGIGRLRIAAVNTAGADSDSPATVLLSITFPYPGTDRAFTEELVGKVSEFRSIAAAYFAALSAAEVLNLDEAKAKAEILRRYNAELRLGKIEVLYFNDYMLLE